MNPLDVPGPAFLVFFAVCGGAACFLVHWLNQSTEPAAPLLAVPTDPNAIAYLRGGVPETVRLACLTLLEEGVVTLGPNDTLRAVAGQQPGRDTSPIQSAVLAQLARSDDASALFRSAAVGSAVEGYAVPPLERAGLIPDAALREARLKRFLISALALTTLAAVKIAIALDRGHTNVGLLVIGAIVLTLILWSLTRRPRTPAGERTLAYLRHTFEPVRARAHGNAHPPVEDVALVAAVFGLQALPHVPYAQVGALQPRQNGGSGSGGADGGGCGGGCGGCGCGG